MAFSKNIKKVAILVGNCPGFVVNRMNAQYFAEMMNLIVEGATIDQCDNVSLNWGFRMGPVKVADLSGLDLS